jgi:hypothetical protein
MRKMLKTFIKTISLLVMVGLILPTPSWSETKIPDMIETDLEFDVINSTTVLLAIRYQPTEDVLNNPPEFILEYGDNEGEYYTTIPMYYDNAIDEQGMIMTNPVTVTNLKPSTVYHYHIVMKYLGVEFDTGDDNFKTVSVY